MDPTLCLCTACHACLIHVARGRLLVHVTPRSFTGLWSTQELYIWLGAFVLRLTSSFSGCNMLLSTYRLRPGRDGSTLPPCQGGRSLDISIPGLVDQGQQLHRPSSAAALVLASRLGTCRDGDPLPCTPMRCAYGQALYWGYNGV